MRIHAINKKGFTLVEAMIFMLIFAVVSFSFYRTMTSGLSVIHNARARIAATEVANEKLEILRNLSYEDLGIQDGNPDGQINRDQAVSRSGISFNVHTEIRYVDDNYDGTANESGSGDMKPEDYKQIEITVNWGNNQNIKVVSHIAPPGTEELYNGGILSLEIRQSNDQLVSGASVRVRDIETGQIIYNSVTSDGKVYLVGLTPKDYKYEVTISKNGFYSVQTLPPYNQTAYNPVDKHGSVVLAGISHKTIYFDPEASLTLQTQDPSGNAIGDINFALEGGRKLGDTVPDEMPVYSYSKINHQTDASGKFTFQGESIGKYLFYWPTTSSANNDNYEFWKVVPTYSGDKTAFWLNPGQQNNIAAILLPKNTPSLFLTIADKLQSNPISNDPISGALVTVKNEARNFQKEGTTDQFGKVYFSADDNDIPMQNADYEVTVHADGFKDQTSTISISNLTSQSILIEQQ